MAVYEGSPNRIIPSSIDFSNGKNSQLAVVAQQGRIPTIDTQSAPRKMPNAVKHIRYVDFEKEVEQRENDGVRCVL